MRRVINVKAGCAVSNCNEELREAWIDVCDKKKDVCGRVRVCDKHYKKIMKYIRGKEKNFQKKYPNMFFAFAPLEMVNEALRKNIDNVLLGGNL